MSDSYHHLTYEGRCQLYALREKSHPVLDIANHLKVHRSTIYRELRRNRGKRGYRFKQAQRKATQRRSEVSGRSRKMTEEMISLIEEKLALQWSPEQIAGWLARTNRLIKVSYETIYQYVWKDKRNGGTLYKNLRHRGKKYNKRGSSKSGRGLIPNRVDIDHRPQVVEEKQRLGDWELDTIIGKGQRGAIVSMVDRASKLTKLVKVDRKTAEEVERALLLGLTPIQEHVLTLTADNGKEFARHQEVARALNADFFFAKPYHSWERGLNEHTNGLVRQYLPKSTYFGDVSQAQLDEIEFLLNNRPRKVLNYLTPIEAFDLLAREPLIVALGT